ncbi:MAG: hypothetical protein SGPRY_009712 [Prymnesium sp.]
MRILRPRQAEQADGSGAWARAGTEKGSCVISLPGAPDQHFHPDGTPRGLVNAFVALVHTSRQHGPTELIPGSHIWQEGTFGPRPEWDEGTPTALLELSVGEVLLFDYRTYHRGCANTTDEPRPVGYLVYARQGVSDTHNFPPHSLLQELEREQQCVRTAPF